MTTIFVAFFLAFAISLILCLILIPIGNRYQLVDRPDSVRRLQKLAIPRLGGVGIFVAFLLPLYLLLYVPALTLVSQTVIGISPQLLGLAVGSSLVLLLGFLDDSLDLRPRWKLIVEIFIGWLAHSMGFRIDSVSMPLLGSLSLGAGSVGVTILWFVACMNAVNLLDGIDGLAAGACLFVALVLMSTSLMLGNVLGILLMACLAGAIGGFLMLNFPPARIYLGNGGSLLLGYLVAALSLVGAHRKAEAAVALLVPIVALGLPIVDTFLAILRRWYHRLPIGGGDRQHIHHVLTSMGYSPTRAVLTLYLVCVLLGLASLIILMGRREIVLLVILLLGILAYGAIRVFSGMSLRGIAVRVAEEHQRRDKRQSARLCVQQAITGIQGAASMDEVWTHCGRAFLELGFHRAVLQVACPRTGGIRERRWIGPGAGDASADGSCDTASTRLCLRCGDDSAGFMVVEALTENISRLWLPETADLLNELRQALAIKLASLVRQDAGQSGSPA